jgi:hypothetical protein
LLKVGLLGTWGLWNFQQFKISLHKPVFTWSSVYRIENALKIDFILVNGYWKIILSIGYSVSST